MERGQSTRLYSEYAVLVYTGTRDYGEMGYQQVTGYLIYLYDLSVEEVTNG